MSPLYILWKFSRPHTIIGSFISISTLFIIACRPLPLSQFWLLWFLSVITGLGCNIFIVGINQIADVQIDKINKPYLPLAAGELSITNAYKIIYLSAFISIILATYISFYLTGIVAVSMLIGMAYSLPPFNLKKHHLPAALAITIVRGLLVNIGGYFVFNRIIHQSTEIPNPIWTLALFIISFSIAISWFKDLPDTEGDAKYNIKTLAILYSKKTALIWGTALVLLAFGLLIYNNYVLYFISEQTLFSTKLLLLGNIILMLLFIFNVFFVKLKDKISVKQFYMRFWIFFFAEYVLYLVAFF